MRRTVYQKVEFIEENAVLVERELPSLGPGQILVRANCSLVSPGTERAALLRLWNNAEFRQNPGYALAGDVVAVGPEVSGFVPGDSVVSLANHASMAVISTDPWVVLPIPEGVNYATAVFSTLASVALHAIRRAQIALGDTFLIIGAGIIGQIAVQLAKLHGVRQVIVLDRIDSRLELALRYGADLAINPAREDVLARVLDATGGQGVPIILEVAGNPQVIPLAFKLAANGGRIVLTGALEEEVSISFHAEFIRRELSLIAAFQPFCPITDNIYWRWTQQENRRLALEWLATGKLRVDEMISHRFPASRVPEVYERVKTADPSMLGILIDWIG